MQFRLTVNHRIHLGELEQVFPVVAAFQDVVGGVRKPEVRLGSPLRARVVVRAGRRIGVVGHHDDRPEQAHFNLQIALSPTVVGMGAGGAGGKGVGDRTVSSVIRFLRQ